MTELQLQIDTWLRSAEQNRWVPGEEICERFGVSERHLRADADRAGLLDDFAVSSSKPGAHGFKHHCWLPTAEWLPIKHRLRRHAIAEFRKVGRWDRGRTHCLTTARTPRPVLIERHTGQTCFFA